MDNMGSLLRKLERLGADKTALTKGIRQAAIKVQGDAKMLVPVDTGQLRNSIKQDVKVERDKVIGRVHTNVQHAPYVEFGTGQRGEASASPPKYGGPLRYRQDWKGMRAQPYLYPAATQNRENVKKIVVAVMKQELRRLTRGN